MAGDIDIQEDSALDTINVAVLATAVYDDLSRGWQQNEGLEVPHSSVEAEVLAGDHGPEGPDLRAFASLSPLSALDSPRMDTQDPFRSDSEDVTPDSQPEPYHSIELRASTPSNPRSVPARSNHSKAGRREKGEGIQIPHRAFNVPTSQRLILKSS